MTKEHKCGQPGGLFDPGRLDHRNAESTRLKILLAAFEEIHEKGFQSASLANILIRTGLTNGAQYHHFPNKQALGYAVVDELVAEKIRQDWQAPLEGAGNPIDALVAIIEKAGSIINERDIQLGCPGNNLAQEMSPVDEGFRIRIETIMSNWRGSIADALREGQAKGHVRLDIDPNGTGVMLVATLEGCMGLAKNAQDREILMQCGESLIYFLNSLRQT